jgi:hypothetical protein
LSDSVVTSGWPRIDDVRGHVLFLVDGGEHGADYSRGWTSLAGRTMFVQADGQQPVSAFVSRGGADRMRDLVALGFMVRDLVDPSGFEASKAAGVQFISTDEPEQLVLSSDPAAPSRCNPVSASGVPCQDGWIETRATDPYQLPADPEDSLQQSVADHADFMVTNSAESVASCASRACIPPVQRMLDQ